MYEKNLKYHYNPNLNFIKDNYHGNIMIDGIYCNKNKKDKPPTKKAIKWMMTANPQKKEKKNDTFRLKVVKDKRFIEGKNDFIMWLGHSSFFIKIDKTTCITDPIFSDLPFASKRKIENPYDIKTLGKIDYILISHAHYDHFDLPTLKKIVSFNPHVQILGPLGLNKLLTNKIFKSIKTQEAGWFQIFKTNEKTKISFLPAKHWHRRGIFDFNKVLWGSFAICSQDIKIYFAGDSAKELDFFKQIDEIYNGFDLCLMPIGAYKPEFLMKNEHLNPEEALEVFNLLNGKHFIPMHYGTYDLSDEPLSEPIKELRKVAKEKNLSKKIIEFAVGQGMLLRDIRRKI